MAIAIFFIFTFQVGIDFLTGNRHPNEKISRVLEWKTASQELRRAEFSIQKGYLEPSALNRPGETIELVVLYPGREFVPWSDRGPNQNTVTIYINKGGSTMGDRFKALMDAGTLAAESSQELIGQRGEMFVLRSNSPRNDEPEKYLFQDTSNGHWISSGAAIGDVWQGEAVLDEQTATIQYHYRYAIEPNPIAMHKWVASFVKTLQVNNQFTKVSQP